MKKRILFRADGNSEIGLGHLYRLFSLVEMLKDVYDFFFLTRSNSELSIFPKEYELKLIPDSIKLEEEVDWISERFDSNNSILILDGYQFHSYYQRSIKIKGFQLIYIDDLIKEHMYADIVINHSPGIKESDYLRESYTKFALGTKYSLLRPSFLKIAKEERNNKLTKITSVFVCFGGADPYDLTIKAVRGLLEISTIKTINVVIGGAYKNDEIFELTKRFSNIKVYKNLSETSLIKLMQGCDLAVVPSSTILYEICSVKMTVLSGYYVDNQKRIYNELLKEKVFIQGGDFSSYSKDDFKEKISAIVDISNMEDLVKNQKRLFDGKSKVRFLGLINHLNICLRRAEDNDLKFVYNLSNEPLVRKNSYNSDLIDFKNHSKWYLEKIRNNQSLFLIALINEEKGGLVRFQIEKGHSVIGLSISKNFRGQKLAKKILKEAVKMYFNEQRLPILAYIKKENIASIKSFESAGFVFLREEVVDQYDSFIYKLESNYGI